MKIRGDMERDTMYFPLNRLIVTLVSNAKFIYIQATSKDCVGTFKGVRAH